jgi:hypothetical protein
MSFSDEISEIVLKKGDGIMTIFRAAAPVSVDVTGKKDQEAEPAPAVPKWTTPDNKPLKDADIDGIVDALSNYLCDEFIEDQTREDFVAPVFTATLKGINKSYSLSFYEKKEGRFPAISSESQYPFLVSEWKANKVMKDFKSLLQEQN